MLQPSRLKSEFQVTVPLSARRALNLQAGDLVGFEINGTALPSRFCSNW